jgi:PD-(D/E)XK endonuclease
MNSKEIGERTEGMLLAKFLQKGWVVLIPFGDNQRYDFVIDRGHGFERIQAKTGRLVGETIQFNACSSQCHRQKGSRDYKGQCEYFAVYVPQLDKCFIIHVDLCGKRQVVLRLSTAKNGQQKLVRWASEFEI